MAPGHPQLLPMTQRPRRRRPTGCGRAAGRSLGFPEPGRPGRPCGSCTGTVQKGRRTLKRSRDAESAGGRPLTDPLLQGLCLAPAAGPGRVRLECRAALADGLHAPTALSMGLCFLVTAPAAPGGEGCEARSGQTGARE